jgi:hypothetical protein
MMLVCPPPLPQRQPLQVFLALSSSWHLLLVGLGSPWEGRTDLAARTKATERVKAEGTWPKTIHSMVEERTDSACCPLSQEPLLVFLVKP